MPIQAFQLTGPLNPIPLYLFSSKEIPIPYGPLVKTAMEEFWAQATQEGNEGRSV